MENEKTDFLILDFIFSRFLTSNISETRMVLRGMLHVSVGPRIALYIFFLFGAGTSKPT